MTSTQYLKNVVTLELDPEKCIGCGMCELVCPHAVFIVDRGKAEITDRDSCMECGACEMNCPVEAISVRSGVGCVSGIIAGTFGSGSGDCDCNVDLKTLDKENGNEKSTQSCCDSEPDSENDDDSKSGGGSSCCC